VRLSRAGNNIVEYNPAVVKLRYLHKARANCVVRLNTSLLAAFPDGVCGAGAVVLSPGRQIEKRLRATGYTVARHCYAPAVQFGRAPHHHSSVCASRAPRSAGEKS